MRVTWTIDIDDAASPRDAALQALEIQRDPDSIATCFEVDDGRTVHHIDLNEALCAFVRFGGPFGPSCSRRRCLCQGKPGPDCWVAEEPARPSTRASGDKLAKQIRKGHKTARMRRAESRKK